jgi:hypothetical protein
LIASLSYRLASAYNEAPFPFIFLIVGSSIHPDAQGQLESRAGLVVLGLTLLVVFGLLVIAWRGARERSVVERALGDGLGAGWREATRPRLIDGIRKRPPLARIIFMPFVFRPFSVTRVRSVPYGEAGRQPPSPSDLLRPPHRRQESYGMDP